MGDGKWGKWLEMLAPRTRKHWWCANPSSNFQATTELYILLSFYLPKQ